MAGTRIQIEVRVNVSFSSNLVDFVVLLVLVCPKIVWRRGYVEVFEDSVLRLVIESEGVLVRNSMF